MKGSGLAHVERRKRGAQLRFLAFETGMRGFALDQWRFDDRDEFGDD